MTTKFVVETYNSVTETTSRELNEYTSRQRAEKHAAAMNSKHGSQGRPGPSYYVVEVDEDGNRVEPDFGTGSTGDAELDALIMGDYDR